MATLRPRTVSSGSGAAIVALRLLAFLLGIFFLFQGLNKLPWLADSGILAERLEGWQRNATAPSVRAYLETFARPGVPLFARLIPLTELSTALSLMLGFWPRLFGAVAFVMVCNFHFGLGDFYTIEFLRDGAGLPVLGGLLAIVIGGSRLPWTIKP